MEIPAEDARFPSLKVEHTIKHVIHGVEHMWSLFGMIYLGGGHFTARIIDGGGSVWYHDGARTGNLCIAENPADIQLTEAYGRKLCVLMYVISPT